MNLSNYGNQGNLLIICKRENKGKIAASGSYKDGSYFKLKDDESTLVDEMAE